MPVLLFSVISLSAQSRANLREIYVFTFPVDKTTTVPLHPETRFSGVGGQAKVDISSRGGAEVKVSISNLPAVIDLGGLYTTYVLWAVAPDGTVQRLSEIKSVSKGKSDSGFKTIVSLTSFGLIVTAEPHAQARQPSRMIVLENALPKTDEARHIQKNFVRYALTEIDYSRNLPPPDKKDKSFRKIPLSLLGARNAVVLARNAGADTDAPDEYNLADSKLEEANDAYRKKQKEKIVELLADEVTSIAAAAEKKAVENRLARIEQKEKERKIAEVNEIKDDVKSLKTRVGELEESLSKVSQDKERYQREYETKVRLNERLTQELEILKEKNEKDSQMLARLQFEKELLQKQVVFINEIPVLEQYLKSYGEVQKNSNSLTVTLPENLWSKPDSAEFEENYLTKIQAMLEKIAQRKECELLIAAYVEGSADLTELQILAEDRTQALKQIFAGLGFKNIKTQGFALNKPAKRGSRRTEITLRLLDMTASLTSP